jgi:hypothetical protein
MLNNVTCGNQKTQSLQGALEVLLVFFPGCCLEAIGGVEGEYLFCRFGVHVAGHYIDQVEVFIQVYSGGETHFILQQKGGQRIIPPVRTVFLPFKYNIIMRLCIKLDAVEIIVHVLRYMRILKGRHIHFFAPAAPVGIDIYKYLFRVFLLRSLCLGPGQPFYVWLISRIDGFRPCKGAKGYGSQRYDDHFFHYNAIGATKI